jgi:hypothetical protein
MSWLGPSVTPTTPIAAASSTPPTRLSLLSHTAGIYQFPASPTRLSPQSHSRDLSISRF